MADTNRPDSDGRLAPCADAFLYTGTLFLLTQGFAGIFVFIASRLGSAPVGDVASLLLIVLSLLAGVLLAWRAHGREIRGQSWLGIIAGIAIGGPLMIAAFFALFSLGRFIPNPIRSVEGPWGLIFVLLIAVLAFLVMPLIGAIHDLTARLRIHVTLDWMRLGSFTIIAVAVIATTVYGVKTGSEVAEVGIFMVPVAAAGACAVLGADLLETWRARRAQAAAPTSDA